MNKIIMYIIGICFILGGLDYILGNKFKIGDKFCEGIKSMGALAMGMIGIYSLAPVLGNMISKGVIPISNRLRIDPSIIPASILAVDMGGWQISNLMASNEKMALFSGIILASSLGATMSFSIPLALGMISKEDYEEFSKGTMIGFISIPIGALASGIYMGIDFSNLLWNMLPIVLFSIALSIGLIKIPNVLVKVFNFFGRAIVILSIIGLILVGGEVLLDIKIVHGLAPLNESAYVVGKIAFVLGGAYPMLEIINKLFKKSFDRIGKKIGINNYSISGLLGNLANNLLIFGTFKEMDSKGKTMCAAFAVSGAFVLGGQLGFVSGVAPDMVIAFIISKFVGGVFSLVFSYYLS
ncbi:MAG: ethanolamine utilization protein EutH [Clostridiaceae bacterium]